MLKFFAVMNGDRVTNTIVAQSLEDAQEATARECIEYTTENPAGDGMFYDRETKKFAYIAPEQLTTL